MRDLLTFIGFACIFEEFTTVVLELELELEFVGEFDIGIMFWLGKPEDPKIKTDGPYSCLDLLLGI